MLGKFTRPSPKVKDVNQQFQARLLLNLIVLRYIFVLLAAVVAWKAVTSQIYVANSIILVLIADFFAYILARSKNYSLACWPILFASTYGVYSVCAHIQTIEIVGSAMPWAIIPIMVCGLVLGYFQIFVAALIFLIPMSTLFRFVDPKIHTMIAGQMVVFSAAVFIIVLYTYSRKRYEEQLNKERARSVNDARLSSLGEMASGIAHEINSPLAAIALRSEQGGRFVESQLPSSSAKEKLVSIFDQIYKTSEKIDKIVKGMRTFSRNAEADPKIEVTVWSILEDTLSLCLERIKRKGTDVTWEFSNKDLSISCRPSQIGQVLLNLINNSEQAIEHNLEKWIKIAVSEYDNRVIIKITDSGKGISSKIQSKIFDPFYTTKEVGKGTGLGLSLSREIMHEHGGTLDIDKNSENTCFVMSIPKVRL